VGAHVDLPGAHAPLGQRDRVKLDSEDGGVCSFFYPKMKRLCILDY
jgi:hypothetical protein